MIPLFWNISSRELKFKFEAGTSKAILQSKKSYFLKVGSPYLSGVTGVGEFGPLSWLSPDYTLNLESFVEQLPKQIDSLNDVDAYVARIPPHYPGLKFAIETALLDLRNGGKKEIFKTEFQKGQDSIYINGLVWMGTPHFMDGQAEELVLRGFKSLKFKVGALDFDQEFEFLSHIRSKYPDIEIRLDANGAFSPDTALAKLEKLAGLGIHSIEQPIATGQRRELTRIVKKSPIPVALDEELISAFRWTDRVRMLDSIKPAYCIFKPTLLGGFFETNQWISLCESKGIGWWITSMLESNIGLNAIAQYAATHKPELPQGLGTGSLYTNNVRSPLYLEGPFLKYDPIESWEEV